MTDQQCGHLDQIKKFPMHDTTICEECIKSGDKWVMLRQCLTCGHVGCCDSSKNKHATKHFHKTNHPIMKSVSVGEEFTYCYVDDLIIQ